MERSIFWFSLNWYSSDKFSNYINIYYNFNERIFFYHKMSFYLMIPYLAWSSMH